MNVLITGATGFIGSHIAVACEEAGHHVRRVARAPGTPCDSLALDFQDLTHPADWLAALAGIDVVINAAGIAYESIAGQFQAIHTAAPCALFSAAQECGVSLVVQISALGADAGAVTAFHRSKYMADEFLLTQGKDSVVLLPSLVFGKGGKSSRFFMKNATLPLIPLPGNGKQLVQPVHIDDLTAVVLNILEGPKGSVTGRIPVVGPEPISLRDYYLSLRRVLGLNSTPLFVRMPMLVVAAAARIATYFNPGAMVSPDLLKMLNRGNTASVSRVTAVLRRPPRPVADFVGRNETEALSLQAMMGWLVPVLRMSLALVWLVTAYVSAFAYPQEQSFDLLRRSGVPESLLGVALYGAALLDFALGCLAIAAPHLRWQWRAQALLIVTYTVIISIALPEFWLHPYGPLIKNIPMLAMLWLLHQIEGLRWKS